MRFSHLFETTGLTLFALALFAPPAALAQTVIGNETLVSTTFVVNKTSATAKCGKTGCHAQIPMFATIPVTCPSAIGQTCTFHISMDAKISTTFRCDRQGGCAAPGPLGFYQFLVDGVAPNIGPTGPNGDYIFDISATTVSSNAVGTIETRQSYPASVVASVTNSVSNNHTISVSVGCDDVNGEGNGINGCAATAHWSAMRVDVFEP
jgi:hypothetical protein